MHRETRHGTCFDILPSFVLSSLNFILKQEPQIVFKKYELVQRKFLAKKLHKIAIEVV